MRTCAVWRSNCTCYVTENDQFLPFAADGNQGNSVLAWHAVFTSKMGLSPKNMHCPASAQGNRYWWADANGSPHWEFMGGGGVASPYPPDGLSTYGTDFGINSKMGDPQNMLNDKWAPATLKPVWPTFKTIQRPQDVMAFMDSAGRG